MALDQASAVDVAVRLSANLAAVLPDGYVVEASPVSADWWRAAAQTIDQGWLVAIDYGLAAGERFQPERQLGTLRAYRRHQCGTDVLAEPGEQDLTAHVDFEALQLAGESTGLATKELTPQGLFLSNILREIESVPGRFPEWTPARRRQFITLTHPQHLGRAFSVFVQTRLP
jgi:SAM-dependent MidA family methyltransferase